MSDNIFWCAECYANTDHPTARHFPQPRRSELATLRADNARLEAELTAATARNAGLVEAMTRASITLKVGAVEYVPAMPEAWDILDTAIVNVQPAREKAMVEVLRCAVKWRQHDGGVSDSNELAKAIDALRNLGTEGR